jgi:hypothetical protein
MLRFRTTAVTAALLLGIAGSLSATGAAYATSSWSVCTNDSGPVLCMSQHPGTSEIVSEDQAGTSGNQNITLASVGTVGVGGIQPFTNSALDTKFAGDNIVEIFFNAYANCADNTSVTAIVGGQLTTYGVPVPGTCDDGYVPWFVENGNRLVDIDESNRTNEAQYLVTVGTTGAELQTVTTCQDVTPNCHWEQYNNPV